jgi:16S rRNA (guanine527-N7)-methyltransferase
MFATEARGSRRAETEELVRGLADAWRFPCDELQLTALASYATSLLRWSARINLTAARTPDALVAEQFPDAFALARRLDRPARVIDIGSGGGLPAIPLALLRPELAIDLCEPIAKKAAFLRTAIRELGLGGRTSIRVERGEAVARALATDRADAYDVAISRATLPPPRWLALGPRLVRPGGRVFLLTTADALPELPGRDLYFDGRRALIQVVAR